MVAVSPLNESARDSDKGLRGMSKLVVSLDGVVIKEVQITKDKTTLGRRPYNDIVIDNLAPFGDSTLKLNGGVGVGAVSSITAAFIAQRLTIGVAQAIQLRGKTPPVYISANIPGGDEHNRALEDLYGKRIRGEA